MKINFVLFGHIVLITKKPKVVFGQCKAVNPKTNIKHKGLIYANGYCKNHGGR